MRPIATLAKAKDESVFGAKAIGLGEANRAGLPVPPGVALSGSVVESVASRDSRSIKRVERAVRSLPCPLAVRSSCVDEDGAQASFAGQHLTILNVPSASEVSTAVREIWWSANSDSAITYRQRVGLLSRPHVGVVVQSLLDPTVAGVLFTQNPINGADERLIEASWGLGEVVVAGQVIPDHFRVDRSGNILERAAGVKKIAIRALPDGGTVEEEVAPELVEKICLSDEDLANLNALAQRCEEVYGPGRDIEWAIAGGTLYLLQCRAVTRAGSGSLASGAVQAPEPPAGPAVVLGQVDLFADLDKRETDQVARLFKERRFAPGETIAKQGAGGASFFVIESGEANVSVKGRTVATLKAGDHFGEIALIDEGARSATVTATTELVAYGITLWDFRPLVQQNPSISWKLMQTLARRLRSAQEPEE